MGHECRNFKRGKRKKPPIPDIKDQKKSYYTQNKAKKDTKENSKVGKLVESGKTLGCQGA